MRRYDRKSSRDRMELEDRLNALGRSSGRGRRSKTGARVRRKRRSNRGPAVVGGVIVVAVLAAIYLIVSAGGGQQEVRAKPVSVEVVKGDTLSSAAEKLQQKGVIGSALMFKLQARFSGQSADIKPGKYSFTKGEDNGEIIKKLIAGRAAPTFKVTVPEGLTIKQTADAVSRSGHVSKEKFLQAANRKNYGYAFLKDPQVKNTEGFLFPKSYDFEKGVSAEQVVNRMLEQYLIETQNLDLEGAKKRLNLSEYQILTVASLIERESASDQERPKIASVIYNRMQAGMPLQIDATVEYARGRAKQNLSLGDLQINSPYNTYKHKGLPPGPICSPSLDSIKAAIHPADTNYLYYVLEKGGKHHFFTSDYNEFLQAKANAGL